MNIFNNFRGFFGKTVSGIAIAAVAGVYAQSAFTAAIAHADTDPIITLNGASTLNLTVGDPYQPSLALNGGDVTTSASDPVDDTLSGITITGGNGSGCASECIDTSAPATVVITYTINEINVSTSAVVGTASVSRTIIISAAATTTPPTTGGQGNNGAASNTGSTTPPTTGGQGNNGAASNTGSTTPPTTGGQGNNGAATSTASTTAPTITLNGANPLVIMVGDTFTDPGATGATVVYGDTLSAIAVTGGNGATPGTIDSSAVATTTLVYTVTDTTNGLSASTSREVDVVAATSTPSTPSTPASTGGSTSFSGLSGAGGGGGVALSGPASTSTIAGTLSCPFITDYIIPGHVIGLANHVNNPAEIAKLQVFLNTYEGDSDVTATGVLDQATINGIIAFQQKYLGAIMGPWGANTPSGNVYITTMRQINAIVCGPQPSLTPAQQAVINAYLAQVAANANANANARTNNTAANNAGNNAPVTPATTSASAVSTTSTSTSTNSTGSTTTNSASTTPNNAFLTGNVVSSGAGNFFGNLFGKIISFFGIK